MKFSIVCIAKNEAKTLPKLINSCIEFIKNGGDFVVYDTGSTDDTVKIAQDLGARTVEAGDKHLIEISEDEAKMIDLDVIKAGDKVFNFADARNEAAKNAVFAYVLMPDCDEVLEPFDYKKIEETLEKKPARLTCELEIPTCKWRNSRLYNRKVLSWQGIIHESLTHTDDFLSLPSGVLSLKHLQNMETDRSQYLKGLALWSLKEPKNPRALFYYGRELAWRGYKDKAIEVFRKQVALNGWNKDRARAWCFLGDLEEKSPLNFYNTSFAVDPEQREALINAARWCFNQKDYATCCIYCRLALTVPSTRSYMENPEHFGIVPYKFLYASLFAIGEKKQAKECFDLAYKLNPENQDIKDDYHFFYDV